MSKEKHGVVGTIIKIIMIIAFVIIGILLITIGALAIANRAELKIDLWKPIVWLVFGVMLLLSPIFLNKKATGFWWVFKIIFAIVFVIIGILLIAGGILVLVQKTYGAYIWVPIVNIVFGALLLTSPYFLKK